jgi:hypothetical protein
VSKILAEEPTRFADLNWLSRSCIRIFGTSMSEPVLMEFMITPWTCAAEPMEERRKLAESA